jgi:hypothetical protein
MRITVNALSLPFLVVAVIGLALSLVAHVAAILGLQQPLGNATWGLHGGLFVVWLAAMLVLSSPTGKVQDSVLFLPLSARSFLSWTDIWKALRGCPVWMRWTMCGFFAYAMLNIVLFATLAPSGGKLGQGADAPPIVFRGFSGHWMAFYSMAAAILYSAMVTSRNDPAGCCPSGHLVSPSAEFCEACGAKVVCIQQGERA